MVDHWIDTSATKHVCSTKELFTSFEPINGEKVYKENSISSVVEDKGKCSWKWLQENYRLWTMCCVSKIHKNSVFGSLLNKYGFHMVFESNKVILSKSRMYVGNGYVFDGLFKPNVMTTILIRIISLLFTCLSLSICDLVN